MTKLIMTYTQEQLDIAILKNSNEGILRTLSDIKSEMRGQFHLLIGLILGIYGIFAAGALAKVMGAI